jgi:hypothetical protein
MFNLVALVFGTVGLSILQVSAILGQKLINRPGNNQHPILRNLQPLLPPSERLPRPAPLARLRPPQNLLRRPRTAPIRCPRHPQEARHSRAHRTKRLSFRRATSMAGHLRPPARQGTERQRQVRVPDPGHGRRQPPHYLWRRCGACEDQALAGAGVHGFGDEGSGGDD